MCWIAASHLKAGLVVFLWGYIIRATSSIHYDGSRIDPKYHEKMLEAREMWLSDAAADGMLDDSWLEIDIPENMTDAELEEDTLGGYMHTCGIHAV